MEKSYELSIVSDSPDTTSTNGSRDKARNFSPNGSLRLRDGVEYVNPTQEDQMVSIHLTFDRR